jgi:hypothetical protein
MKNFGVLADDDCRLIDRDAAVYLGFRSVLELRARVEEGALRLGERRDGRDWFRLTDLRDYSRNVALLSRPTRGMASA